MRACALTRLLVVAAIGLLVCAARPVAAEALSPEALPPEAIKERIEAILSEPPFGRLRTVYEYRYRGEDEEKDKKADENGLFLDGLFSTLSYSLGSIAEVLLWTLIIAVLVLIFLFRDRWLPFLQRGPRVSAPKLPTALFGADESVEPLPDDIVGKAWELWQQGEARACLSLLYRGALLRIILARKIELPDSATEEDCLRAVIPTESPETAKYFQALTRAWQATAYAARGPAQEQAESLVQGWREHFGEPA